MVRTKVVFMMCVCTHPEIPIVRSADQVSSQIQEIGYSSMGLGELVALVYIHAPIPAIPGEFIWQYQQVDYTKIEEQ